MNRGIIINMIRFNELKIDIQFIIKQKQIISKGYIDRGVKFQCEKRQKFQWNSRIDF